MAVDPKKLKAYADESDDGLDVDEERDEEFEEFEGLLEEAREELKNKTKDKIEAETADKWAARSIAAHELGQEEDAAEYEHEAIEHAAMASDQKLGEVRAMMKRAKK